MLGLIFFYNYEANFAINVINAIEKTHSGGAKGKSNPPPSLKKGFSAIFQAGLFFRFLHSLRISTPREKGVSFQGGLSNNSSLVAQALFF